MFDFFIEEGQIVVKEPVDNSGNLDVSGSSDLADDGRIGLTMGCNALHGVIQTNYLLECAVEGADARAPGADEGLIDVKEQ